MSDETTYEWNIYPTPRPGYETPVIIRTNEGTMSGYMESHPFDEKVRETVIIEDQLREPWVAKYMEAILEMMKDSQGLTRDDFALAPPAYREGGPVGH